MPISSCTLNGSSQTTAGRNWPAGGAPDFGAWLQHRATPLRPTKWFQLKGELSTGPGPYTVSVPASRSEI